MTDLFHYMQDGAGYQARAVLMHLQGCGPIQSSWDEKYKCYRAEIKVARWENCREQGYVVMLKKRSEQINIAFYEHRNSDGLHALVWTQNTINSPTLDTANFEFEGKEVFATKYDTSFSESAHEYAAMAERIYKVLKTWYESDTNN